MTIPFQFLFCSYYLLENFKISPYVCVGLKSIQILTYNVSILTMVVIAIDRYQVIHKPLQLSAKRLRPRYSLVAVWLLAFLFAVTCLVSMKVSEYFLDSYQLIGCRVLFPNALTIFTTLFRKIRVTVLAVCFYLIPLIITTRLYLLCVCTIAKRFTIGESNYARFSESKRRTIKVLIVILLVFALCWLPIHVMNIKDFYFQHSTATINQSGNRNCNASTLYTIFYWLAINSCCYNPFIYSWFNRTFRQHFRLRCFKKSSNQKTKIDSNIRQTPDIFHFSVS